MIDLVKNKSNLVSTKVLVLCSKSKGCISQSVTLEFPICQSLKLNNFQLCSNVGGQLNLQYFPFHGEHFHFLFPSSIYENMATSEDIFALQSFIYSYFPVLQCFIDSFRNNQNKTNYICFITLYFPVLQCFIDSYGKKYIYFHIFQFCNIFFAAIETISRLQI